MVRKIITPVILSLEKLLQVYSLRHRFGNKNSQSAIRPNLLGQPRQRQHRRYPSVQQRKTSFICTLRTRRSKTSPHSLQPADGLRSQTGQLAIYIQPNLSNLQPSPYYQSALEVLWQKGRLPTERLPDLAERFADRAETGDDACRAYEAYLAAHPDHARVRGVYGIALLQRHRRQQAEAHLLAALRGPEEVADALREMLPRLFGPEGLRTCTRLSVAAGIQGTAADVEDILMRRRDAQTVAWAEPLLREIADHYPAGSSDRVKAQQILATMVEEKESAQLRRRAGELESQVENTLRQRNALQDQLTQLRTELAMARQDLRVAEASAEQHRNSLAFEQERRETVEGERRELQRSIRRLENRLESARRHATGYDYYPAEQSLGLRTVIVALVSLFALCLYATCAWLYGAPTPLSAAIVAAAFIAPCLPYLAAKARLEWDEVPEALVVLGMVFCFLVLGLVLLKVADMQKTATPTPDAIESGHEASSTDHKGTKLDQPRDAPSPGAGEEGGTQGSSAQGGQDEPDADNIDITPLKPPKKPTGKPPPATTEERKPKGAQGTPQ